MERVFVGLDIAVLAVSEAASIAADPPSQAIVDRLRDAGHRIVQQHQIGDSVQLIRAKLLEHIADSTIDVVIVVAGMNTESAGIALDPLITRGLNGFSDLLRMIAYQEIGSAAMLVDAEAAQCKSTFVFILPASMASVKIALDKLLVPQLDYRTKPRNLVMQLPRIGHHDSPIDESSEDVVSLVDAIPVVDASAIVDAVPIETPVGDTARAAVPWIVPRTPGEPVAPPPRPTSPPPIRKSMSMSVAQALPKASVSDVVEKTALSVSQRMSSVSPSVNPVNPFSAREITDVGPPPAPPPLPRGKVSATISAPLPVKPPAKLIPLAELLPVPVAAVAPIEPAGGEQPVRATPTTETEPPALVAEVVPLLALVPAVVDAEPPAPVVVAAPERKMASLADLEDEGDDLDELENDVAEIVDEPPRREPPRTSLPPATLPIRATEDEPPRREARASMAPADLPPRRTDDVSPLYDDSPRRIAIPREPRRRDRRALALVLLGIMFAAAASIVAVVMIRRQNHEARAAGEPPPGELVATRDTTQLPPDPPSPPTQPATPTETAAPPETATPTEIDMSAPPDPGHPTETAPTGTTPTGTAPTGTAPTGTAKPARPARPPREPAIAPVSDPADVLASAPVNNTEDGCDEVSCILDKYRQACCARFKPAEPDPVVEKPSSGLPEKLDKVMVQEGMGSIKPAVIACGEQNPARGTVKVSVKVSPAGKIQSVGVAATPDPALGACVAAAVKLAKFPETDEGGSFGYPFVF